MTTPPLPLDPLDDFDAFASWLSDARVWSPEVAPSWVEVLRADGLEQRGMAVPDRIELKTGRDRTLPSPFPEAQNGP